MDWITLKECKELTKKSESTLRKLARQLKESKSKNIRFEKLPTGHEKILFKLSFINSSLLISKPVEKKQLNKESDNNKIIQILENQLNEKDRQIESLHNSLQAQNLLLHNLQESIKLIEAPKKKKRWFGW